MQCQYKRKLSILAELISLLKTRTHTPQASNIEDIEILPFWHNLTTKLIHFMGKDAMP